MSPFDPGSPIRQRWRVTFACTARGAAPGGPSDVGAAWSAALAQTDLPLVMANDRPRVVVAMPLPESMAGEAELFDLFLTDRRPVNEVRDAVAGAAPGGFTVVDIHDVWVGTPALPGQVAAVDYRVELGADPGLPAGAAIEAAIVTLLAAAALPRTRAKGGGERTYDLRPLLGTLSIADPGPPPTLRIRTLVDPTRGSGRPDEVVAALAGILGGPLAVGSTTRERIVLADV
jgi:hypothetical protein